MNHKIIDFSHIALIVKDIEKMISFYEYFADMEVIHKRIDEGVKVAWLRLKESSGFIIVMIESKNLQETGYQRVNHFGFDVNSKELVDLISKKAQEIGVLVYPAFDGGEVLGYLCMIKDPDGNQLEFAYGQMKVIN